MSTVEEFAEEFAEWRAGGKSWHVADADGLGSAGDDVSDGEVDAQSGATLTK